jgi:cob(I)alamin adenosyltransferase
MTFDHRPGTEKLRDLATLAARGLTGLFERELGKCDLVCANCHAVRTFCRREEDRAKRNGESPRVSESQAVYVTRAA